MTKEAKEAKEASKWLLKKFDARYRTATHQMCQTVEGDYFIRTSVLPPIHQTEVNQEDTRSVISNPMIEFKVT